MLDSSLLVSVIPGAAKMMPNTAIGFMLVAHALWYRSVSVAGTRHVQSWYATLANVCAGLAVLVGLVTLVEYLAGFDLGIDTLLFPGRLLADRGTYPGRMSEAGAKMEILDEGVIAPTGAATFDRFHQCAKARCRL
jgi:hypothetical protein